MTEYYYYKYQKYKHKYYQTKFKQHGGNTISDWSMVNPTMTEIEYTGNEPVPFGVLPNGLTKLTFGNYFDQPIGPGILPDSLKFLKFGDNFNQPIEPNSFPTGLRLLKFGQSFNQPLDNYVPTSLECLILGYRFNQVIKQSFYSENLKRICFNSRLSYIFANDIPEWIDIHYDFNHIDCENLNLDQLFTIDPVYDQDADYGFTYPPSVPSSMRRGALIDSNTAYRNALALSQIEFDQTMDRDNLQLFQQKQRTGLSNRYKVADLIIKTDEQKKQLGDYYQDCPICNNSIYTTNAPVEFLSSRCNQDGIILTGCCDEFIHQCCVDWYFKPVSLTEYHPSKSRTTCPLCRRQVRLEDGTWLFNWELIVSPISERKARLLDIKRKLSEKKASEKK